MPRMALFSLILLAGVLSCAGCGDEELIDPDKLCRNGAAFGARISGTPSPVDMCVADGETTSLLGGAGRYDVTASFAADSVTVAINVSFLTHAVFPRTLIITDDPILPGPDDVWIVYRETRPGVYDYSSLSISGVFTLTFSDATVAVATFNSLRIDLEDAGGAPAGTRMISEGFLAVTPDNPAGP
ncbi:MAG: hypothetical protein ACE5EO_03430 [Candidatus Krumholzibacteriia bacterium]